MTRASTRVWYRIAVARPDEPAALYAAEGEHLGAAVAAAVNHIKGAYAISAEVATGDQIPLGESVGKHQVVALGELAMASAFRWPIGVLPQIGHDISGRRGFVIHPDRELLVIEARTDAEHVTDLFLGLIERLPAADNLEIRVLDHFENAGTTDVWLTSRVDAKKILRFLDDHDELIENGHLELSIYVRKHNATLRLTEHKAVVWLAKDDALRAEVEGWLGELDVPRVEPLVRVEAVPHLHYRPAKSRDRAKLAEHLYRQRLRRVDKLVRE